MSRKDALHASALTKRITFERPTQDVDKYGDPIGGWTPVATVWAAIRPMGSNERLIAMQTQSGQTHVVTVRYSTTLAAARGDWRIIFNDRVFQTAGQPRNPDERNESLVFDCTEGPTP